MKRIAFELVSTALGLCCVIAGCTHRPAQWPEHLMNAGDSSPWTIPASGFLTPGEIEYLGPAFQQFAGIWAGDGINLVLAPRRIGDDLWIYGAIPTGDTEGALCVKLVEAGKDAVSAEGYFWKADSKLSQLQCVLEVREGRLVIRLGRDEQPLTLRRCGKLESRLLARIGIIGHMGGGLDCASLNNSIRAFETAFMRGCTGVELDVVVARRKGCTVDDPLVVHHVSALKEILGWDYLSGEDSMRQKFPSLRRSLEACVNSGIGFVYVDPKLKWLLQTGQNERAEAVLDSLIQTSKAVARPGQVLIGAECTGIGQTADMLAKKVTAGVDAWFPEFTMRTQPDQFASYFDANREAGSPSLVSVSVLGTHGWPGLKAIAVRDMHPLDEEVIASMGLPVVVWTVLSDKDFAQAVQVLDRLAPSASQALMTDHPHRLAYFLGLGEDPSKSSQPQSRK